MGTQLHTASFKALSESECDNVVRLLFERNVASPIETVDVFEMVLTNLFEGLNAGNREKRSNDCVYYL